MHSHIIVNNIRVEYLLDISYVRCLRMFQDGILTRKFRNNRRIEAKYKQPSFCHAGSIKNDGSCQRTQYSGPYGTWDNVIVDAIVRINLRSSHVPVHLSTGRIMLKSGTICELNDSFCIDYEDGHTFWKPMPTSSCNFHQYDVLYEGLGRDDRC